jgi:CheY-like chemotaxis protein
MEKRDILFVDDDNRCLEIICCQIEQWGLKVNFATSGEEAIGILKKSSFSMMITDLNMPGMDGFELALLAKEFSPHMEIVMATGEASPDVFRLAA